jgi:hypothetical protein
MKKTFCLVAILSALAVSIAPAQPGIPSNPPGARRLTPGQPSESAELTKFDLDFPGGTPRKLADTIEKSMGKPLNVIIPDEYASAKLPPIKVTGVTVPQLFQTILEGSYVYNYTSGRRDVLSSYGFKSIEGTPTDATIWTFFVYKNNDASGLAQFSLDFPGGTPKELVATIQKASGKPLNVIIPPDSADTPLPPLKMNAVNVNQLFRALEAASTKAEPYSPFPGSQRTSGYGFRTDGNITDDSIWYFHADKASSTHEKISRFYALAPYLERGLKVDDITTAVETAWKMAGETSPPEMSFHKDTKLLIAVGDPEKLQTIDSVLQALKPDTSASAVLRSLMEKRQSEGKTNE